MPHPRQAIWECQRCRLKGAVEIGRYMPKTVDLLKRMEKDHRSKVIELDGADRCPNDRCVARVAELKTE